MRFLAQQSSPCIFSPSNVHQFLGPTFAILLILLHLEFLIEESNKPMKTFHCILRLSNLIPDLLMVTKLCYNAIQ